MATDPTPTPTSPTPVDDTDPVVRVLQWIDGRLAELDRDIRILEEVRDRLRLILGDDQPDGWLQIGHRGDEVRGPR